jgi:hypothetical protein
MGGSQSSKSSRCVVVAPSYSQPMVARGILSFEEGQHSMRESEEKILLPTTKSTAGISS